MQMFEYSEWLHKIEIMIRVGLLGIFGAAAKYLHDVSQKQGIVWSWFNFFAYCFIAAFASNVTYEFIPASWGNRDGYILMVGYCCIQVLNIFEQRVIKKLNALPK
jgi:hypothetical protein